MAWAHALFVNSVSDTHCLFQYKKTTTWMLGSGCWVGCMQSGLGACRGCIPKPKARAQQWKLNCDSSDHVPIEVVIMNDKTSIKMKTITKRSTKSFTKDTWLQSLAMNNWEDIQLYCRRVLLVGTPTGPYPFRLIAHCLML